MEELLISGTDNKSAKFSFHRIVDQCPYCKKGIQPQILNIYIDCVVKHVNSGTKAWVVYKCPYKDCRNVFVSLHKFVGSEFVYGSFGGPEFVFPFIRDEKLFGEIIQEISPNFIKIYNEAFFAEQNNLLLIAGPGYRKALEFLIKDYVKSIGEKDDHNKIENTPLGRVIKDYIDNDKIKEMAKRAVWLGNDETHYLRKWDDKNLGSLKILLELTIRWIESVELSRKFKEDMPE